LATSLEQVPTLVRILRDANEPVLDAIADELDSVNEAANLIRQTIIDDPPAVLKDGGFFREGYNAELDEWIVLTRAGKEWFQQHGDTLRSETGISSLKIRFNNVFGYFIEVTKANLHRVPDSWLRKQTLVNAERYYTPELKEYEEKVLHAQDRRVSLEQSLFESLRDTLSSFTTRIRTTAAVAARLDVLAALAEVAHRQRYVRPELHDGTEIQLENARHAVIETLLPEGEFVPNSITIDQERNQLVIITGPNMAGKSTTMRQVALIVLMAQMGGFVPAEAARIGLVDHLFTRVGASDNLTQGQSTFMVEMVETAQILANATDKSLIIVDEIGRGTSTYDGVSIAWAVAEYIHDQVGARTLFATHYHELTELAALKSRVVNMSVSVKEWQNEIIFLRRLVEGGANRSYGIQVAKLAGIPERVITQAQSILANLEASALNPDSRPRLAPAQSNARDEPWQLRLFAPHEDDGALRRRLTEIEPDTLTPRQALDLIYELKILLERG
jgi:DNA mismatch repair protein MutS